jgi:hypothetical protein
LSIRRNPDKQPWDDLPADLQGALKALYRKCEHWHITYGHATQVLCYDDIHETSSADHEACSDAFEVWWRDAPEGWWKDGAPNSRFRKLTREWTGWPVANEGTPSSIFRAYFDYYIELIANDAHHIFADLIKTGCKNETRQKKAGIEWAKWQAGHLIRSYRHLVADWVCATSDKQTDRRSWHAPTFLAMKPAGREPYETGRVWERMDWTGTRQLLEAFVHEYVLRLEDYIEDDAAEAYGEPVKHPEPAVKTIERSISNRQAQEDQVNAKAKDRQALIEQASAK